jgi:hypothetical protein
MTENNTPPSVLSAVRVPLPWAAFGFPEALATRTTTLLTGDVGWAWSDTPPAFEIPTCEPASGVPIDGWDLDHVVLLVPDLEDAIATMDSAGYAPRLRMEVGGRPTAFFRVGPVLEVIQSPVRREALFGIALVTDEALEVVVLRWRSMGLTVTDPRPAIQPGRRIFTVKETEAGLAVMSSDRSVENRSDQMPKMS